MLYVLKQRLIACEFHNQADLGQCFNALIHFQDRIVAKVLHNIDLFSNVLEFVRVFVHLKFLVNFYCN